MYNVIVRNFFKVFFFMETGHFCFSLALRSSSKTKVNDWTVVSLNLSSYSLIKCTLILLLFSRKVYTLNSKSASMHFNPFSGKKML